MFQRKVSRENLELVSPYQVEFGNAVYITGENVWLGGWSFARRMTYDSERKVWFINLPWYITRMNIQFKYLFGKFELGENVGVAELVYEGGVNRNTR